VVAFNGANGTAIYTHLDSTSTATAVTTGGSGRITRVRDDLWVQDLGNGNRRFVFVFWTTRGGHGIPPGDA
jgi:hypothetical protein